MTAVAIEGVWKFYGDFPALADISLNVPAGTCVALIGRNGAGKTTLLRMLAGLSKAAKGNITILGGDARAENTRKRIGVLGHGIGVYEELSAFENLRLFARLYGAGNARAIAMEWLERTGLERVGDGLVREFSRGMRQRLAVARAFLHNPALLLLDEPFTALDDRAIAVLQGLLRSALAEGRTVIMSTHQLREALELATDVALINRGKLAFRGERTAEMLADPGWLYRQYGGGMTFLSQALAIAGKDLRSEVRSKETVNAALSFALVILMLFSFAFDPSSEQVREIAGGLLWLVYAFAGTLILNRSFARELVNDCLDALISSPASGAQLFLGKCLANYVLLMIVECVSFPVFIIFYNSRWPERWGLLFLVLLLGTWGITVIGTLFSAMTVNLKLREMMLPTLVYPMLIPALMGAIQLSNVLISGEQLGGDNLIWFKLLVGFDLIFTILSLALVEIVLVG